jgi:ribosomal protein S18 acetylase RimI-like enzyme
VQIVPLDLSDDVLAGSLLDLQQRAYAIEAELVGSDEIPPLRETVDQLRSCHETFLGALVDGLLVGAVSWRLDGDTVDIHRLVVDPACFRRGIGATLVRATLAAEPSATSAIVQTGARNEPAKALYLAHGFEQIDEVDVAPGLRVARFVRRLP